MCNDRMKTLSGMLQIMNGFRPGTIEHKYVIVCTKPDEEWRVGLLTTEPIAPVHYLDGHTYGSVEAAREAVKELEVAPLESPRPVAGPARPAPDLVGLGHALRPRC